MTYIFRDHIETWKMVSLPLGKENCGQPKGHICFQIVVSDHMYICA